MAQQFPDTMVGEWLTQAAGPAAHHAFAKRRAMNPSTGRLYALDNLRALMMWLGVVLHTAAIYMVSHNLYPWSDDRRTVLAEPLIAFIHAFRMPVFFILAGFFVAMLLQSRGPAGMARHRAMRLGLPFVVFWVPVLATTVACALLFIHRIERNSWGIDWQLIQVHARKTGVLSFPRGPNTIHMWFLWMLLWMSLVTAALARWVPAQVWRAPARALRDAAGSWWGPFALAMPLVVTDGSYPNGILYPSGSFLAPMAEWTHWALFFVAGLAIYGARDRLFPFYVRRWREFALAGLAGFVASGVLEESGHAPSFAWVYGITGWCWSFALVGLALKWMPSRNAVLAYLAEASYWVYLVHLPLAIGFGALLYQADEPALLKMVLNIAATTSVCLASYHWFVRRTWIGALLNGKRHELHPVAPQPTPA
jgi:glucan biosynthesis protein C